MLNPYFRLMRLHQPVGVWLLLWPCWWSLALASPGLPSPALMALFAVGALAMRSAGCIVNDMADRDFDRQVERTSSRPLASGALGMRQAATLLALLLLVSCGVAALLGRPVFAWSAAALPLVAAYPFMKRITWWPQLFLGLTFNWGALLGWVAVRGAVEPAALCLYIGGVFWTLGYDTIYAHQDKRDDARIGVKSTALRLGGATKLAVRLFYVLAVILWAIAGIRAQANLFYFATLALAQVHFGWQVCSVDLDSPASARKVFASNVMLGALVQAGALLAHL
jgi:4-hydroxybenzoate polyprenyltransferase